MGRLLLHIGLHKTGTSAFQRWCMAHSEALHAAGIAMPVSQVSRNGNASLLAEALTSPEASQAARARRRTFIDFCKANAGKDILVSAERLELYLIATVSRAAIDPILRGDWTGHEDLATLRAGFEARIAAVAEMAEAGGLSGVHIAYLVRNDVDRINSGVAQRAKALARAGVPDSIFRNAAIGYKAYEASNRLMQAQGFAVDMGVLNPAKRPVVAQIFGYFGLGDTVAAAADVSTPRANESIGEIGVLAGRHLYQVVARGAQDELRRRRKVVSQILMRACEGIPDKPFSGFTPQGMEVFGREQARLNAVLTPWLTSEEIDSLARPRSAAERSPLGVVDLSAAQREVLDGILTRVGTALQKHKRFPYPMSAIMDIGDIEPRAAKALGDPTSGRLGPVAAAAPRRRPGRPLPVAPS